MALYEALEQSVPQGANDLRASSRENGYSVSIIVLAVLVIESFLNRLKHLHGHPARLAGWTYFKDWHSRSGLADECTELFVVRDIIVHNHIWKAEWDHETMRVISAQLTEDYGDTKYNDMVDTQSRKTTKLGLNVFPLRIHLADVEVVLRTVRQIFDYLKTVDPASDPGIVHVRYGGNVILLSDFLSQV